MQITLNELFSRFKTYTATAAIHHNEVRSFLGARLLTSNGYVLREKYIYVGQSSQLPSLIPAQTGLIVIDDCGYDFSTCSASVIVLSPSADIPLLLNDILEIFYADMELSDSSTILLNAFIEGKGLKDIIDVCFDVLQNPVILIASTTRLLTISTNIEIEDAAVQDLLLHGYSSKKFVAEYNKIHLRERLTESPSPILVDSGFSKNLRRIIGKITVQGKTGGYLLVLENNHTFQAKDINIVHIMCGILAAEIQKNQSYQNFMGTLHEYYLTDLLNNNVTDFSIIDQWLTSIKWAVFRNFYAMVIELKPNSSQNAEYIRSCIEENFPTCKSVYYNKLIVVLVNLKEVGHFSALVHEIEEYLHKNHLAGGISTRFESVHELKKYYNQAKTAKELGIRLKTGDVLNDYSKLGIYDLLHHASKTIALSDFSKDLDKLDAYDKKNGTDYYSTLYEYIKCATNKSNTAKKIFVHRNTISYRIHKIEEIVALDLEDGDNLFHLYLSYAIKKLEQ